MILDNNILTPIPFYTDKKYQDRYKYYGYGDIFPLFVLNTLAQPFQFSLPTTTVTIPSMKLVKLNADGSEGTPTTIPMAQLDIVSSVEGNRCYVVNKGTTGVSTFSTLEGRFYMTATETINGVQTTFYSEVITLVPSGSLLQYLKLEWWNTEPLVMDGGLIYYDGTNYKNVLYLPTTVGKPTYQFEEEGEERNGYFFAEKQISRKQYVFSFLAPEYLCDALRFLRMHDFVTVTENGITYEINQIETDVEWQTQGNLASVTVRFYCNTVAKAVGKMPAFLSGGDYNDDFNDDFNNE